jgi:hypothetical protein
VARINPNRQAWSKEIIVTVINDLAKQGYPLSSNHIQTKNHLLYAASCKYFGGWSQAILAAGLDYASLRKRELRSWSKQAIVAAAMARSEAGKPMSSTMVGVDDPNLYSAAKRHFGLGGWAKVRVLAGLDPVDHDPRVIWTEETVKEEIKNLHRSGVALNASALRDSDYDYIRGAGRKVFGTWENAITACGLNYVDIRKGIKKFWTPTQILSSIKLLEKQGIRLSSKACRIKYGGLFGAAVLRFGSWSQAVEAAGIPYRKHCLVFSTKAWLRRMNSEEYNAILKQSREKASIRRKVSK